MKQKILTASAAGLMLLLAILPMLNVMATQRTPQGVQWIYRIEEITSTNNRQTVLRVTTGVATQYVWAQPSTGSFVHTNRPVSQTATQRVLELRFNHASTNPHSVQVSANHAYVWSGAVSFQFPLFGHALEATNHEVDWNSETRTAYIFSRPTPTPQPITPTRTRHHNDPIAMNLLASIDLTARSEQINRTRFFSPHTHIRPNLTFTPINQEPFYEDFYALRPFYHPTRGLQLAAFNNLPWNAPRTFHWDGWTQEAAETHLLAYASPTAIHFYSELTANSIDHFRVPIDEFWIVPNPDYDIERLFGTQPLVTHPNNTISPPLIFGDWRGPAEPDSTSIAARAEITICLDPQGFAPRVPTAAQVARNRLFGQADRRGTISIQLVSYISLNNFDILDHPAASFGDASINNDTRRVGIMAPGAIVRLTQVVFPATETLDILTTGADSIAQIAPEQAHREQPVTTVGYFMLSDYGTISIFGLPRGYYRVELVRPPAGFNAALFDYTGINYTVNIPFINDPALRPLTSQAPDQNIINLTDVGMHNPSSQFIRNVTILLIPSSEWTTRQATQSEISSWNTARNAVRYGTPITPMPGEED